MPELRITEAQQERLDALRDELAARHAGAYASVRTDDVVAYLLDLAEAVEDPDEVLGVASATRAPSMDDVAGTEANRSPEGGDGSSGPSPETGAELDPGSGAAPQPQTGSDRELDEEPEPDVVPDTGGGADLGGMLNLLETHDDKWREASGEERYEVELEDGSVETARTKDDVKAILFKHY